MGELGIPELLIILAIVLVLFGPSRLTNIGQSLGTSIREFRTSVRGPHEPRSETASSSNDSPVAH